MKTAEEIKELADIIYPKLLSDKVLTTNFKHYNYGFIQGYTKCQQDNQTERDSLKEQADKLVVEFSEWKDKEYPCMWYSKYAKPNSSEWFTIQQLYELFKQSKH